METTYSKAVALAVPVFLALIALEFSIDRGPYPGGLHMDANTPAFLQEDRQSFNQLDA
jgi:hypothetical protein